MNTKTMNQEQISALVDNELTDAHVELALAALRQSDERETWDIYHQIGDVMRSEDMTHQFSADFNAKLMARLDVEPTVIAPRPTRRVPQAEPQIAVGGTQVRPAASNGPSFRRFLVPTAIAAMAVFALVSNPQLRAGIKPNGGDKIAAEMVVSTGDAGKFSKVSTGPDVAVSAIPNGVVLRDPRIDDYLMAHQRYSPSLYSTAQYSQSTASAMDSNK